STGVPIPPKAELEKLREITEKHRILLIFVKVITAFGRLVYKTATEMLCVTPDIITLVKGISNAAVPAGAVAVRREIHDKVMAASASGIEFFHGYTYSAHPLATAAIRATLDIYKKDQLFERARDLSPYMEEAVHQLKGSP